MSPAILALVFVLKLLVVEDVQKGERATLVTFKGGEKCTIAADAKGYEATLALLEKSRERKVPVGVTVEKAEKAEGQKDEGTEPGRVTQVVRAESDRVLETAASPKDPKVTFVKLQGHAAIYQLHADNPEHRRIAVVLADAIKNRSKIWFVVKPGEVTIADAIPLVEAEKPEKAEKPAPSTGPQEKK